MRIIRGINNISLSCDKAREDISTTRTRLLRWYKLTLTSLGNVFTGNSHQPGISQPVLVHLKRNVIGMPSSTSQDQIHLGTSGLEAKCLRKILRKSRHLQPQRRQYKIHSIQQMYLRIRQGHLWTFRARIYECWIPLTLRATAAEFPR
jgi:hypothetical protein